MFFLLQAWPPIYQLFSLLVPLPLLHTVVTRTAVLVSTTLPMEERYPVIPPVALLLPLRECVWFDLGGLRLYV